MVPVSLFDTLRLSLRNDDQIVLAIATVSPDRPGVQHTDDVPPGATNLVVRAIERLREATASRGGRERLPGLDLVLCKRIPTAAGLGGGSSDAAAALIGANLCWELNWSRSELADVAAQIGSDVPFFLWGTAAVCRGRGERVEPCALDRPQHYVIVRPPRGLATADVYRHTRVPEVPRRLPRATERLTYRPQSLFNRLELAARPLAPWLEPLRGTFQRLDLLGHQMTGSGSCYFGVCRNAQHANRVAQLLRSRCDGRVFRVRSCHHPVRAVLRASQN
jgi:4-diphosphocytidyl-2-C-methyl-D-erythritol kinase